jgi:hypothetical protein
MLLFGIVFFIGTFVKRSAKGGLLRQGGITVIV